MSKILDRAKIGIMLHGSVFLSTITFSMRHRITEDEVPTAATDGKSIIYNREFFENLTPEQRIGLVAHESWHTALTHMTRRGHREPGLYNKAGDYVINQLLVDANFEIPPNGCQDNKYRGMSTNQVYDLLEEDGEKAGPDNQDIIYAVPGDGSPDQEGTVEDLEAHIKGILVKAQTQSKMQGEQQGSIPGEIERTIDDLINPKLPWEAMLARFLTEHVKDDYTWRRPNKRFAPDFYMPTQYSEALAKITIAIDTSGSMSQDQLTKILTEIQYIKDTLHPKELTIIDCDSRINNVYNVTDDMHILDCKFTGGGGTSCFPVLEYCEKNPTTALVYFTDLYLTHPTKEPDYPLLWIVYDNPNATIDVGQITHYDI